MGQTSIKTGFLMTGRLSLQLLSFFTLFSIRDTLEVMLTTDRKKGFTLIELMISIAILGIVASVGLVIYNNAQMIGRDAKRKQDLQSIANALEIFYQQYKRFPCSGTSPNPWMVSTDPGWLSDSIAGSCNGTGTNLYPSYISPVMPKDPKPGLVTASPAVGQWGYAYWSSDDSPYTSCAKGQYYILVTHLENPNDKDRLELKPQNKITICGNDYTTGNYGTNAYFVYQH